MNYWRRAVPKHGGMDFLEEQLDLNDNYAAEQEWEVYRHRSEHTVWKTGLLAVLGVAAIGAGVYIGTHPGALHGKSFADTVPTLSTETPGQPAGVTHP